MNILTVSISAPPKNSPESLQTGKYLKYISGHHHVSLLTTRTTGGWEPEDKGMLMYVDKIKERIELRSLPARLITIVKKIYPSIFIPDDSVFFFWQYKKAVRKISSKPDLIFSRSAPFSSSVMAMKLAQHFQVPWVMHLSDIWEDSPFYTWSNETKKRQGALERLCLERASIVTLTSQKTISFYQKKYPKLKDKFEFLPNVFDADDINTGNPVASEKLKFVFTGRLYGSRSIHSIIDAFEKAVQKRPEINDKFELILAGFFGPENIERINQSGMQAIKYVGPLDMKSALRIQREAHVLVLIDSLSDDILYQLFFPSKLLDYLAAKRFILAITGKGSTTHEVVEGNFGKCFDASTLQELPDFIIGLIDRFLKKDISFLKTEQNIEEYSAAYNANRLMSMFAQLVKKP